MKRVVIVFLGLLIVFHQDFWWWHRVEPMVLGFIPIGLAWHVGLSLLAAVLAAMMVRYCWPANLEDCELKHGVPDNRGGH